MKLIKRTYIIHGGKELNVLLPLFPVENMTGMVHQTSAVEILTDSEGYDLLSKMFWLAAHLKENEFIFIPVDFKPNDKFKSIFEGLSKWNFGLFLLNYHALKLKPKDILELIKIKTFSQVTVSVRVNIPKNYVYEDWDIKRKLTVKPYSKFIFFQ